MEAGAYAGRSLATNVAGKHRLNLFHKCHAGSRQMPDSSSHKDSSLPGKSAKLIGLELS